MKPQNILTALAAALIGLAAPLHADDIDLYTGGEQNTGAASNVLIVLDNTSNFSTTSEQIRNLAGTVVTSGEAEAETISTVLGALTDSVNVGLMQYADGGGGYPIFGVRPMTTTNKSAFQSLAALIKANVGSPEYKGPSSPQYADLMNSVFRYYNGFGRFRDLTNSNSDPSPDFRDWPGNTAPLAARATLGDHGYAAKPPVNSYASNYRAPGDAAAGCAKNYVIFIGNSYPGSNTTQATNQKADLITAGTLFDPDVVPATTGISTAESLPQVAPYWTKFMHAKGVKSLVDDPNSPGNKIWNNITTYTIDVCNAGCNSNDGPKQAALLKSMASEGGGKYFKATNQAQIQAALQQIFAEIQAVNSVFASATLPISVNTQGTYENQVYIGVFRPDGAARPRWYGNLKEYKFGLYCDANRDDKVGIDSTRALPLTGSYTSTDERVAEDVTNPSCATGVDLKLYLADQNGYRAIDESGGTGFIDLQSTSFWTSTTALPTNFWSFAPDASGNISDAPDGPSVERGGAAQKLRTLWATTPVSPHPDGRTVYTCLGTCLASNRATNSSATPFTLSGSALTKFTTANTELTTALAAPGGSVSVSSLTRSGDTVTVTTSSAHPFIVGDATYGSAVISGASPSAYNGTKTVLTKPSATTFTYSLIETPSTSVTGATVAAVSGAISVGTLGFTPTTAGSVATVTVTGASAIPAGTTQATIANAAQSFLNGTFTGTTNGAGQFVYTVTLPSNPGASGGSVTAKCGTGISETVASSSWSSATGTFTFDNGSGNNFSASGCKNANAGTSVVISGSTDPAYNGTWSILSGGVSSFTVTKAARTFTSPDTGTGKTIMPTGTITYTVDLTRTLGSQSVVATLQGGGVHTVSVGNTITVSNSTDAAYNGNWTVSAVDAGNHAVTFSGPALGPTSPATGTIIAAPVTAGVAPTTDNLITWTRGKDLWEDENINSSLTDVRASIHGDVLHSRPAVINYGGTIGIVGFYGSNDGFLRAIKGGVASTEGSEKWAFMPQEFASYNKLSRLYGNSEAIRFPNSACSASPAPTQRGYYWDGQITVYTSPTLVWYRSDPATTTSTKPGDCSTDNPCYSRPDRTIIYASMRRGGRSVYALDVTLPDNPKFLWKIDNTMTNFDQLGQTWSEPKVAKIKGKKADATDDLRDVLIFGAGYDPTDDDQPAGCPHGDHNLALTGAFSSGASSCGYSNTVTCPTAALASYSGIGRGVFVVDALTGEYVNLLKHANTNVMAAPFKYSFPADVGVIDMDGDGYVDRVYAGDSGGQLFRFDFDSTKQLTAVDAFKAYHLASFGATSRTAGSTQRKFLFPPEIVPFTYKKADNTTTSAVMVLAGTGDREKPLPNQKSVTCSGSTFSVLNQTTCSGLYSSTAFGNYFGAKVRDKFYGYVDTIVNEDPTTVTRAIESDLTAVNSTTITDNVVASFNLCTAFETTCSSPLKRGWVMNLKNSVDDDLLRDEEKMVNAPKVVSGLLLFGTNTPKAPNPSAGICSNLGQALAYAVDPFTGAPKFDRDNNGVINQNDYAATINGGGLPPTVTSGVVGIGDGFYRFVIGAGGEGLVSASSIAGARNPITLKGTRSRVYWYYPTDEK